MTIQQQLLKIQKVSGKSQEELARELSVSFPTLNSWINGKSQPRKKALEKINSLYLEYFGDLSIGPAIFEGKIMKLKVLKQKFPNTLSLITSRKDIYDNFLLSLTYNTNSIEGSTLTEPEVKSVIFDDLTISGKSVREHQEAKNHQTALRFIIDWIKNEDEVISQELIKHIHHILMNGILDDAGKYRTHSARIVGSRAVTSNHLSIEKHMNDLVKILNLSNKDILNQVKHLAQTHARFEQIHPFADGNGRVGRLLMIILAFKYQLAPTLIKKEKKQAYYSYLEEAQTKNNYVPLTAMIFDGLLEGYTLF